MSSRVVDYKIVFANGPEALAEQVCISLNEGWQPHGPMVMETAVCQSDKRWYQPMTMDSTFVAMLTTAEYASTKMRIANDEKEGVPEIVPLPESVKPPPKAS